MNQRKYGVMLSYVSIIVNTGLNFVYVPLLLSYMGQGEYGLYRLMGSFVGYFAVMDFGLAASVINYYSKYKAINDKKNMQNVLAIASIAYFFIILIVLIAGAVVYFKLDSIFGNSLSQIEIFNAKKIYILLLFNVSLTFFGQIFDAVITSNEKFVFLKTITLVQIFLQPIFLVLAMQISPYAYSMVCVQSILNFCLVFSKIIYSLMHLKMKIKFYSFDRNLLKGMIGLSSSSFLIFVVDQIFFQGNQILLGIFSGTTVVAVYAVAAQLYMNYMTLSGVISNVFLPKIASMEAQNEPLEAFSNLLIRIGRIQYLILGLILSGFILYGKQFIVFWVGENFIDAYWMAVVILIPFTIDLIQNICLPIMQVKNCYGFRAKVYVFIGILDIILIFMFAIKYGGIGCAIVTGGMMFLGNGIIMNYYYFRYMKLNIGKFWMEIFSLTKYNCFVFILGLVLDKMIVLQTVAGLCIRISIYFLLYIFIMYFFAMNQYEKNLIAKKISFFHLS